MFLFGVRDSVSSYYYTPFRWKLAEVYTLRISSKAKDVNGNTLTPFLMTFVPEPYFRVRIVSPSPGSVNVSPSQSIYLSLNSPVDTVAFSLLQVTPAVPGGRWFYYPYRSPRDSSYLMYYHDGMNDNTTYTVNVSGNFEDKFGNRIKQPFSSSFSTARFRVSGTYPSDGATNVGLTNSISIYLSNVIDTSTARMAFSISPAVAGNLSLYDQSLSFSFYPTGGFSPNTRYTVTLSTLLRSKRGGSLDTPYSFSFTTAGFRVTSTTPPSGANGVSRSSSIYINFNGAIDTGTVRSAFGISPGASGTFYLYDGSSSFSFYPFPMLTANQMYTVTISTAMQTKSGYALDSPYEFFFTTGN